MTRRSRGGIKGGESTLASNHFPMCSPQSGSLRDVHRVTQRREEGGRRQRWRKGGIKRRVTDLVSNQFTKCSLQPGTYRDSQGWVEKRRVREKIEVTSWRKMRVKRREQSIQ